VSASRRQREAAQSAWHAFCDRLKDAGAILVREDFPVDELDLAEGLRYLGRVTHASIERFVDGADPARPYFYPLCNERIKIGGDNPDNLYFAATVSSRYTYRVRGDFRGCSYYSLVATGREEIVQGSRSAKLVTTGLLNSESLATGADGITEITIGAGERPGNHLAIDGRTNLVIVRCTIEEGDARQVPLGIERTDASDAPPPVTTELVAARLMDAANHVCQATTFFGDWTAAFQAHVNELPLGDQPYIHSTGGDPNIQYYLSAWRIEPSQALEFRIPQVPACRTWNLQLCNVWMESLDYTQSRIHVNSRSATPDRDGGVTIVASEEDPGHPNWIRTQGHTSGTIVMRLVGARDPAVVETRLVDHAAQADPGAKT
jgi:hypothetical protein